MSYARNYSVLDIKKLMQASENYGGHGISKHHNISDNDALYFHKSAFLNFADTGAVRTERYSTGSRRNKIWHTRDIALYTRTVSDQPSMVSQILFKFGSNNLKNFPQSLPGIEHTYNNGAQRRLWQWNNHDQNHGNLIWKW